MDLELVTVGTELLLGFTIDTNAAEIGRAVSAVGARVVRRASVGDDVQAIREAVADGLRRTGFVVVTGGLGPTTDDVTKRAVAELFDAPLEVHEEYLRELKDRFARYGRAPMPPSNRSQAEVPRGATVLHNPRGTAPGLLLEGELGAVMLLPGVPLEMRLMVEAHLVPLLERLAGSDPSARRVTRSRTLRTTGITESGLASGIAQVEQKLEDVSLAFLPGWDGVDLRLTAWNLPEERADVVLDRAEAALRPILGEHHYGVDETDLAGVVIDRLRERDLTLAVAESCTGGIVGARLTAMPGASDVFRGAVAAYANEIKIHLLGVPAGLIEAEGAVSEAVARAMAHGVSQACGSSAAVAVTGIAGPAGGTVEKPVGTVWLAATVGALARSRRVHFPGDREEVRHRAAQAALDLLRRLLS